MGGIHFPWILRLVIFYEFKMGKQASPISPGDAYDAVCMTHQCMRASWRPRIILWSSQGFWRYSVEPAPIFFVSVCIYAIINILPLWFYFFFVKVLLIFPVLTLTHVPGKVECVTIW